MVPILDTTNLVDKIYTLLLDQGFVDDYCKTKIWSREQEERVAKAYAQFLALKGLMADFAGTKLLAPPMVASMMMEHVLHSQKYSDFCDKVFGRMLHYDKDFEGDEEVQCLTLAVANCRFGTALDGRLWRYEDEEDLLDDLSESERQEDFTAEENKENGTPGDEVLMEKNYVV